jgi:hypothetical protein
MKKSLHVFLVTTLLSLCALTSAYAIPFIKVGPKVGYGTTFPSDSQIPDSATFQNFAAGAAAQFSLLMLQVEANVLYQSSSITYNVSSQGLLGQDLKLESSFSTINIPVIARFDFSIIPLLNLAVGTGYEQRVFMSSSVKVNGEKADGSGKVDNNMTSYIPFSFMAMLNIPALFAVGLELRYSYQLTSWMKNGKTADDFMVFGTILF